jgi:hypothetical protein
MAEEAARHIVDEDLHDPASYLSIRKDDRVYDLYGWAVGGVAECRIAETRDEFFDGLLVDFRGRRVFVDAPEVRAVHDGVVVLALTVADLARGADGRPVPPRRPSAAAAPEDAVALMAALSRMYAADAISLGTLESDTERVLKARTCGDLDAIASGLLPAPSV